MTDVYERYEIIAFDNFKEFANRKHWFKDFAQTPPKTYFDVLCTPLNGKQWKVELKGRIMGYKKDGTPEYEDCYIEFGKHKKLVTNAYMDNMIPVYINFINDWRDVYVWNLFETRKLTPHYNCKVKKTPESTEYKTEDRFGLDWKDAYHYVWDEKNNKYIETKPQR